MAFLESFCDPAEFVEDVLRWLGDTGDERGVTLMVYGTKLRGVGRKPQINSNHWVGTFTWKPGPQGPDEMHVGEFLRQQAENKPELSKKLEEGKVYAVCARDPFEGTTLSQTYVLVGDPELEEEVVEEEGSNSPFDGLGKKMEALAVKGVESSLERMLSNMGGGSVGGGPAPTGMVALSDGSFAPQQWMLMQAQSDAEAKARLEAELKETRALVEELRDSGGGGRNDFMNTIGTLLSSMVAGKGGDANPMAALLGAFQQNNNPGVVQMPNGAATVAGGGFDPEDPYSSFLVDQVDERPVNARRPMAVPGFAAPEEEEDEEDYDEEEYAEEGEEEVLEVDGIDASELAVLRPFARELFGIVMAGFTERGEEGAKQAGKQAFLPLAEKHGFSPMEVKGYGTIAEEFAEMLLQALPAPSKLLVKTAGRPYVKGLVVDIIAQVAVSIPTQGL